MRRRPQRAFTIIELMVVVVIMGVLAALAIPGLMGFVRQSRTSEVGANLANLFRSSATFYARDRANQGLGGGVVTSCIVEPTTLEPATPSGQKQRFSARDGFRRLGFTISDYVYYGYGIASVGAAGVMTCQMTPETTQLYTFFANGDLDGDTSLSTFELAVGSDPDNNLYHARGIYVFHGTE